jgi:hypothetical protein
MTPAPSLAEVLAYNPAAIDELATELFDCACHYLRIGEPAPAEVLADLETLAAMPDVDESIVSIASTLLEILLTLSPELN